MASKHRLPLEGRVSRRIEIAREKAKGGNRVVLDVYPLPPFAELPDTALYHALLATQAVLLLAPSQWEIPLYGDTLTPDAYMVFPWGEAYLEVDTGHYPREVVRDKLRFFTKNADRLFWASPSRSRLLWVQSLAQTLQRPLTPLWLPPVG
ncbi:hypothetical protein CSW29_03480 [Thermus scotoductus]|uniref:Uncharacterized protein n=1 Tax=Thermus scotoductus TaxID=37636 RepID=A0A430UIE6_THESC|nr:hypothetical protein CSW29_03480 [Thermus scotoductus]